MPTFTLQQRNTELDAHNAKLLARFAQETNDPTATTTSRNPAGHERVLRAIPVIAKGISGTIPGTQPHSALR
jgi:hypothetical protein